MFEEEAANAVWDAFKKGAGRGALAGQIGGTYPLNTGESFGEFDDAGVDLTADQLCNLFSLVQAPQPLK